jgi:hypothetical protein
MVSHMMRKQAWPSVLATVLFGFLSSACSSDPPNGTVTCAATAPQCPEDLQCRADGKCWKPGTGPVGDGALVTETGPGVDGISPVDGPRGETHAGGESGALDTGDTSPVDAPGAGGGGAGGAHGDLGGAGGAQIDAAGDAPSDAPQTGLDGSSTCVAPRIPCNGDCIDPSTSCCVATDCKGSCMSCGANHVCTAVKNQPDPSLHCAGTCDATGTCKGTPGQTCKVPGDCANGTCVDGYCCDGACTGSCQACDVDGHQGTCTTLSANLAPHVNHPACSGTDVCAGYCSGSSSDCTYPTKSCGTASCSTARVYQATGTCKSGSCNLPNTQTCSFACDAAKGGCTGECVPQTPSCRADGVPLLCDAQGVNQPQTACANGFTCSGGLCTCTGAGLSNCTTACTNLLTDSNHCGACGHSCLGGLCLAGACQPVAVTAALSGPPQVFGVDNDNVYFLVPSASTNLALDAYRVSKSAVGQPASFLATSEVMGDWAGVIGSTLFDYGSGGGVSLFTIGTSSALSPGAALDPNRQNFIVLWRSVAPRYYAETSNDGTSFRVGWFNLSNSLITTASQSATAGAPSGGSVNLGSGYAGGDSVYWMRTIYDSSYTVLATDVFTASVSSTTPIQLGSGSPCNIVDVNAKSLLLSDGSSLYRIPLPAVSSTSNFQYVAITGSMNAVEDANGIYYIDNAYAINRCGAGNCGPTKVRLATDQPTYAQAHAVSTLFQDATALYWGRVSSVTGTGANQIMRLAK